MVIVTTAAMGAAGDRHDELMELVARVAKAGDGGARATLARIHLERGEVGRALALLGEGPLSADERALHVRALRQDGRIAEAEAIAREALREGPNDGALWMEVARCRLAASDLDGAEAATTFAASADAHTADNEALAMEVHADWCALERERVLHHDQATQRALGFARVTHTGQERHPHGLGVGEAADHRIASDIRASWQGS